MAGTWSPSDSELGVINELVTFSHTVTYADEFATYAVTIVPTETNPNTIIINGDTISGYYTDSFPMTIQYLNKSEDYITVAGFSQIDETALDQMISYKASTNLSKVFTYTAIAKNEQGVVVEQKTYTKTVENDWTSGRDSLVYYVGKT
jgi:hypothetical protein